MVPIETFPNPPITEAAMEILVALPPDVNLEGLLDLHPLLAARFPLKAERIEWKQQFQFRPDGVSQTAESKSAVEGYFFTSTDKTKIVQARLSGFGFSKLKPYTNWEQFSAEASELWEQYCKIARPQSVKRIGLRYINRIEIPLPIREFRDYCVLFPEIPPNVPQQLSEFFMRFVSHQQESGAFAAVTMTFEPPSGTGTALLLPLILDIDVSFAGSAIPVNIREIWQKLDQLRDFKNLIFFSSVTDTTTKLFR